MSSCETGKCESEGEVETCLVEKSLSESCCPVEKSVGLWTSAFFQAMKEAQVEILKQKIQKAWGSLLDKEGDAVIAAMGAHWRALLTQAKAQADLRETIKRIYEQALQK